MSFLISVIIPTHNPDASRLERTLLGLKDQTLPYHQWELVIVDNATLDLSYVSGFDISWHSSAQVVRENRIGLTHARLAGIKATQSPYLVFVDDDNILHSDYLKHVIEIFAECPKLGAIGGKSLPEFEVEPEPWVNQFWICLALRDLGDEPKIFSYSETDFNGQHPEFAPIGAGMALRRSAAEHYVSCILEDPKRLSFDRTGRSLQSGGDCDINLTLLEAGWAVGYFPQLQLTHLISANRLTKEYLAKLNRASSRSWVQVLDAHQIRPWRSIPSWSVLPRQLKAWFNYQPWKSPTHYVRWQGACGMFEGLASLSHETVTD